MTGLLLHRNGILARGASIETLPDPPEFISSSSAVRSGTTSVNVNYPAGKQAGDVVLVMASSTSTGTVHSSHSSGQTMFARRLDGTEGATFTVTASSSSGNSNIAAVMYRGVEPAYGNRIPYRTIYPNANATLDIDLPGVAPYGNYKSKMVSFGTRLSSIGAPSTPTDMTERVSMTAQPAVGVWDREVHGQDIPNPNSVFGGSAFSSQEMAVTFHLPPVGVIPTPYLVGATNLEATQANATPITLDRSAIGVEDDDIEIIVIWTNNNTTFLITGGGGGWNFIDDFAGANMSYYLAWRRVNTATHSDPVVVRNSGTNLSNSNGLFARSFIYRGCVKSGTPYEGAMTRENTVTNTFSLPSTFTGSGNNRHAIVLLAVDDDNAIANLNAGMRPEGEHQVSTVGGDAMSMVVGYDFFRSVDQLPSGATIAQMSASDYFMMWAACLIPEPIPIQSPGVSATGGTITTDSDGWREHRITEDDDFIVSGGTLVGAEVLIVGGGGSGGLDLDRTGGGGGGGEVVTLSGQSFAPGTYPAVIGSGGIGNWPGNDGGNTTFNGSTAQGGGRGGAYSALPGTKANGGGGYHGQESGGVGSKWSGGRGYDSGSSVFCGGGGAGDGGNGVDGSFSAAGNGGPGTEWPVGSGNFYGGGGGGGAQDLAAPYVPGGTGGQGGGGNGATMTTDAQNGTPNTGGGGGGGADKDANSSVSDGGSGVVVVRYHL
jgi:hypothetical protein